MNEKIDVTPNDQATENKPTLELGNYIISIRTDGNEIKRIAIANAEIFIEKLADGGMTVDLK
jgi:hypothetical protein